MRELQRHIRRQHNVDLGMVAAPDGVRLHLLNADDGGVVVHGDECQLIDNVMWSDLAAQFPHLRIGCFAPVDDDVERYEYANDVVPDDVQQEREYDTAETSDVRQDVIAMVPNQRGAYHVVAREGAAVHVHAELDDDDNFHENDDREGVFDDLGGPAEVLIEGGQTVLHDAQRGRGHNGAEYEDAEWLQTLCANRVLFRAHSPHDGVENQQEDSTENVQDGIEDTCDD